MDDTPILFFIITSYNADDFTKQIAEKVAKERDLGFRHVKVQYGGISDGLWNAMVTVA